MRHDYDLPADYDQRVADGTMVDWYTQERCRRQAMNQDTAFRDRVERAKEKLALRDRFRKFVKLG